ncbi:nucleoside-diphosphate-sugar epimerase [Tenacibaculum sp. Bg11-29]|uniref:NAD-dependent epimerase/dehydratase family protein n=1 Tax=Tenacibaculum sp. Bg11-29 TaxID=2058306 RepID=UPI000C326F6B|nr:NAD-dependent epimerase/dehydratase family protein [Tenacibaculum sp. Bg11-29]PKH52987.1 nucleoside-diphosphate-sugar epimerase [Tenacibaculum sp. Bg11-29]
MKVTITGTSGFVGTNLLEYFDNSKFSVSSLSARYKPVQEFFLQGYALIHLAGKAHDLRNVSTPNDYYESNFELTKQLFDSFIKSDLSVFIFMSTVKACADEVKESLKEEDIPNPKTHYGLSKQKAEEYILNKKLPVNKRAYILRPCMIHGPNNKGNLNLLYKLVKKRIPWPLGNYPNQRSFLSIDNLMFCVNEFLSNDKISSGIYNLADDKTLSTNEIITLISNELGVETRIFKVPKFIISFVAKLGDIIRLPINNEKLQKLTSNYVVSNLKVKNSIKKILPVSSEEGMIKTINSFKKK